MVQVRKRECALLIGAEQPATEALVESLERRGCTLLRASSATEAFAMRRKREPELVICCEPLCDFDEVELVALLKGQPGGEEIPILVALGASSPERRLRAYEAGASDVLEGPIDSGLLVMRALALLRDKVVRDKLSRAHDKLVLKCRKLEAQRRELAEAMEFIAHDLKTPLQVTLMGIEWVLRYLAEDRPALGGYLEEALGAARRTQALVQDLIYSVVSAGTPIVPRKQRAELEATLQAVVDVERYTALRKGIELRYEFEPGIEVEVDPWLLQRVLFNLLENSFRFTPESGVISLAARLERDVVIEVANSGPPVDEVEQCRLFENYVRGIDDVDDTHRGLGLFFCKRVVEAHGGTIELGHAREFPVCFRIRLPRPESFSRALEGANLRGPGG